MRCQRRRSRLASASTSPSGRSRLRSCADCPRPGHGGGSRPPHSRTKGSP
jgi:hypothetical protein